MSDIQDPNALLVDAIHAGDMEAEAAFYKRYYRKVRFLLEQRTNDFAEAEDLAHDTLIIVLRKLRTEGLNDPSKLAAYIQATAKNVFIGKVRLYQSRRTHTVGTIPDDALGEDIDQLDIVLEEEATTLVRALLAELTQQRDREILRQHYILEKSKPVVCDNLGLTAGQFDRVLYKARQRFKQLLLNHRSGMQGEV